MSEMDFDSVLEKVRDKRILVANRGIPARRICRSIREVFKAIPVMTATDVDRTSPPTSGARELMLLGSNPREYLNIDRIIRKAKERGVIAIHPGWGFSAEDDSFPEKCQKAGLIFIGPDQKAMQQLGNKVSVRKLAKKLGVPTIPGSEEAVTIAEAREEAHRLGFPIMLKAEGGGGGRGIYEIFSEDQLEEAFLKASTMAQAAFGNPRLYVEKLLTSVRHIEIQVVADLHGNVVALDERDCSVQRNHQKLIEITPSPWPKMTPELRKDLKSWSIKLVSGIGYHSLATVEFLVEADGTPFMVEVNTRLQVEHGITECRYGLDLVEEQIAIAFGAKLRIEQEPCALNHAMQVRVNCEDPKDDFSPNSGTITRYISPGGQGVRIDSCISSGYEFPSDYDSAASLLIAYGSSWEKVLGVMDRALSEYIIRGVKTTIPFHRRIIRNPVFRSGEYDTNFLTDRSDVIAYTDSSPMPLRNSRLVAEISALGYNAYVQLDEYRSRSNPRMPRFKPVLPDIEPERIEAPYPRWDRDALLDYVRDSDFIHFTDTTTRDITQSNSGNRFRLAEDRLVGPYLDNCGFLSLENGGGAHFHVALLANMTYPFSEAAEWNEFAPKTPKQILIRSTNVLGYKPQPRNLMTLTGEMINEHYEVIRCFDFLNHIENMQAFAEVALNSSRNVFEPAISLSYAQGFDIPHYLGVVDEIVDMCAKAAGVDPKKASRMIILGLKDMAGVCPPRFISALVEKIRAAYPELILHYHRHCTDGLFVPAVGAAAKAGAKIVDTAIGASVRWYGQGDVLATAAYIEEELGLKTQINKEMIRNTNFVLKQIMPWYDRYTAPHFQGVDHEVVNHAMPGGATSSSQEGAMKQGFIHLLPQMLRFLAGTRRIIKYHDVTPGSQITWNTAFLAVTETYKRGGSRAVEEQLKVLEQVAEGSEEELSEAFKAARLTLYRDCNDAFRDLLSGKFGRLPLGFPPDWVYRSAFGSDFKQVLASRTTVSPLELLDDMELEVERDALRAAIRHEPTDEEFVLYLNHPGDALKTIKFQRKYGDPNLIPLDIWFEGIDIGEKLIFRDHHRKPHEMVILDISKTDPQGMALVNYTLDSEYFSYQVQVSEALTTEGDNGVEMADPDNPRQVAAPSNGDLWVMYVKPGDRVHEGEELFNVSIMKQEKSVTAPVGGMVKRVLKTADYEKDRKMVSVKSGELLVELGDPIESCPHCQADLVDQDFHFCPACGQKLG